ncbi:DUF1344 domain-containing protein [Chelativorans salis]|uniref:DUF1344 domain-containing protein n=1 Tax=Chelativorans salis TaxID=2978478 RepID=A0ABT2LGM9_9HYPH|nr:DUF1344 domain-containing protein [Chelativorans sp. EGI FJ00035]MCT7373590.1 DUF1344 domain-containing protein [Chelativorans sp. EGI FJ00035]
MRIPAAILSLALLATPAIAADTEGTITTVDQERMTITLQDGETYKLPPEIDMSAISDGMEVVIAYRVADNGEKQIMDMLLPE